MIVLAALGQLLALGGPVHASDNVAPSVGLSVIGGRDALECA